MTHSIAVVPKCLRDKKFMMQVNKGGSCCKRYANTHKNDQKRDVHKAIFLTNKAFTARYDELTELSAQLASNLRISKSLQSKRKNTQHNGIITGKSEKQAMNFSSAMQGDTTNPMQFASSSLISWNTKLEMKDTKHNIAPKYKKPMKEKKKDTTVSDNSKIKTKNLVKDQVNTQYDDKGKYSKLTRQDTKNKTETENKSNIGNILKKNNETIYSKKIIKNDAKKKQSTRKAFKKIFSSYIPISVMKNILKKQSSNGIQYVKGNLRINPFSAKHAYLSISNEEHDLVIMGIPNRNRAFEGDLVVACVNPENLWRTLPSGEIQKTGKVVCILEKVHPRRAVGYIKKHDSLLLFYPRDHRIPLVEILPESMPPLFRDQPELFDNMMFLVNIDLWERLRAFGRILSVVGKYGEINTELTAVILENNLDLSPYHENLLKGLPGSDYILTDTDMKDREDWRHECIFTIDPVTAVDIDDAFSCKILDNGNYEIGVHISDVTHYLKFFSPLDKEVLKRATTVYLPHMTSHMLPEELCKVCSLLPGKDSLAFSVIWEMTPEAKIVKHRFAKTMIRSCCQMSYDSAQAMLNDPKKSWPEDFLDIKGDYTASLLSDIVNKLFKLSTQLQNKRFVNGALKLCKPNLRIDVDPVLSQEHGIPIPVNYHVLEKTDSNSLVEEFMLLANMTVAVQLYTAIPETALLRVHKEPKHNLYSLRDMLQKYGIHLNIETAYDLQASINRYEPENNSVTVDSMKYIAMAIVHLCSKTMARAEYICASTISLYDLKHYALNVSFYTHFTSPIRRYSDCIVHRLLNATLENKPLPEQWTIKLCSEIAANCNVKKYNAKLAYEQSTEIFFAYMVGLAGGFTTIATVLCVKEDSIEILLCDTGIKLKVKFKDIENDATLKYSADDVSTVTVNWKEPPIVQVINLFSLVHVQITKISEEFHIKATLLPPPQQ
ncbi:PREDICTED: DIS3-like exonuclease 2 [Cyphomyrmex costatus]|uniref:DIS3-like exonuclease 2 n=1 Tax=Cyphomyrmex costatus TaxID=456900 RepID=A0A151I8T7_9HYME|nr:PREDICTED: DIS3-like exonuclease 2 [Cyphomyrmex costatus]KYM95072.1 DIS3-like exonuclease 2 [Cyphomyrmex costatus]